MQEENQRTECGYIFPTPRQLLIVLLANSFRSSMMCFSLTFQDDQSLPLHVAGVLEFFECLR